MTRSPAPFTGLTLPPDGTGCVGAERANRTGATVPGTNRDGVFLPARRMPDGAAKDHYSSCVRQRRENAVATDLPYMPSVGNVASILEKIKGAGTPPKFTVEFVKSTLGFTGSQDRSFPRMLKQLGFIASDGTPLQRYNEFKATSTAGRAMAEGLREGWSPIFMADQAAHTRSASELTDIFKTVTGQGDAVAKKMASTFKAFASHADWSAVADATASVGSATKDQNGEAESNGSSPGQTAGVASPAGSLSLHHDIHLHLPPSSDVAVYRAIFRALREELQ